MATASWWRVIHHNTASAAVNVLLEEWQALTATRRWVATARRMAACRSQGSCPKIVWAKATGSSTTAARRSRRRGPRRSAVRESTIGLGQHLVDQRERQPDVASVG